MSEATVTAAGLRIVRLLVGNSPRTITELMEETGVTRTAVTEQLNDLLSAGFVERGTEKLPCRGRPRHLYRATDAALLLMFTNNQRIVMPAIWKAIDEIGGDDLTHKVFRKVSRHLAEYYNRRITAKRPEDRLKQFMEVLRDEGGLIEAHRENGQMVIYRRSCPFVSVADAKRAICGVDQEVLSAVVGRPVHRTACRHEGAPCCTFEVAPPRD